jgi:hypothetical protein
MEDLTTDSRTAQWYRRARSVCEPFMFAAARFRTPWVDDEFAASISTARQWLRDNPSPDRFLGQYFVGMLSAYAEMTNATVARVMELRMVIEQHVEALDRWKRENSLLPGSSPADRGSRAPREARDVLKMPAEL